MPSKYTFTEYSNDWPLEFEREAERLASLMENAFVDVLHIGSTSVPGLPAKPIIDVLPIVSDISAIDKSTRSLVAAGYQAWGEYGIFGRRLFTKDGDGYRTHNVHVFEQGNPEIDRHLAFCSYLRSHERVRDEYAQLKRAVFALHPADIEAYNNGKNEWIKRVEALAIDWYRRERSTPARSRHIH